MQINCISTLIALIFTREKYKIGGHIMANILITGATGMIGTEITKHLIKSHTLTLVDYDFSDFPSELTHKSTVITDDLADPEKWAGLLDGIHYVIQLAGDPDAGAEFYDSLLELNYKLPHNLYEEAKKAKDLKRIIYASSNHAMSGYPNDTQMKVTDSIRPGDLYGVSKAYIEALATYHAYEHGVESIGLRIGAYTIDEAELQDMDKYQLAKYLSVRDLNHLIDCCIEADLLEASLIVNGVSNNTFSRLSNEEARVKLGYKPKDDAFQIAGIFN